jgi:hypothetical protein
MLEGGGSQVAIHKSTIREVGICKINVLQVRIAEARALEVHSGEKGVRQDTIIELQRKTELIAVCEIHSCHFASFENDVLP